MTQYQTCAEGLLHFIWIRDPRTGFRVGYGQLNKKYTTIREMTSLGISGIEDVDWECISSNITIVTGELVRVGVRDGDFNVDIELTKIGFNGIENTDWINIEKVR